MFKCTSLYTERIHVNLTHGKFIPLKFAPHSTNSPHVKIAVGRNLQEAGGDFEWGRLCWKWGRIWRQIYNGANGPDTYWKSERSWYLKSIHICNYFNYFKFSLKLIKQIKTYNYRLFSLFLVTFVLFIAIDHPIDQKCDV